VKYEGTEEIERLQQLVDELRAAVEHEVAAGLSLERWGGWSHGWNAGIRAWRHKLSNCIVRASRHARAHRLTAQLFPAWQAIHYTLTRKQPPDMRRLEKLEAEIRELTAG